jgi:ADP-ribose pyrophosphatase
MRIRWGRTKATLLNPKPKVMTVDDELLWKKVASEPGPDLTLFQVRFDLLRHPHSSEIFKRLVLESADWVNVVAVNPEGKLIMVNQYRSGIGEVTIEPVAGMIDPGEDSLTAAERELLEETGYGGGTWRYLGSVHPNSAIQNNLCHHWFAEGVVPVQPANPEAGEVIRVRLMTLDEIREAVAAGTVRHSLSLSALSRVYSLWDLPYIQSCS